jgi:hypothetical protein
LIWLPTVKRAKSRRPLSEGKSPEPRPGRERLLTTVDPADIRGLVTA